MNQYLKAKQFLYSLIHLPKSPRYHQGVGLRRMEELFFKLNQPCQNGQFIHIAGTSGKGSTAIILHTILAEAGSKTASFTSPHLTTPLERFQINGRLMPPSDFVRLLKKLTPLLNQMSSKSPFGPPSYFEVLWALGLLWFEEQKPDWIVTEAGIGGLLDATNIITPKLTIITEISFDHTALLGRTLSEIALQKAGVIKPNIPTLSAHQNKKVLSLLQKRAAEVGSKLEWHGHHFQTRLIKATSQGSRFVYQDESGKAEFTLSLVGEHQIKNAALAIRASHLLGIPDKVIQKALQKVFLPARLEAISQNPTIILDGAHNPAKIKTTIEALSFFSYQKLRLILAILQTKDIKNIVRQLPKKIDKIYITQVDSTGHQPANPLFIHQICQQYGLKSEIQLWPKLALEQAISESKKEDLILVTGSFYLAGRLREQWWPEESIVGQYTLRLGDSTQGK